jgi:hypothetical protein
VVTVIALPKQPPNSIATVCKLCRPIRCPYWLCRGSVKQITGRDEFRDRYVRERVFAENVAMAQQYPDQGPDEFRSLDQMTEPDARQRCWVIVNPGGGQRPKELSDHHAGIKRLSLVETVPEKVRVQFATAKNLLLYSWFVYRFIPEAELKAYATVELALRVKFSAESDRRTGLRNLLERAVEEKLITDSGYRHHGRIEEQRRELNELLQEASPTVTDEDSQAYCRILAEMIPHFRNVLAHGKVCLHPHGNLTLELCCDTINQLF